MTEESVYAAAGGREGLVALAHAWHRRCLDDPMASHPFSHRGLHPQHVERLAAYWAEALGGPADFSATMSDHATVMRMHACNEEHPELDARAIELFVRALDDAEVPARVRPVLESYFREMTTAMAAFSSSAVDVPGEPAFPHWSWDGPVD